MLKRGCNEGNDQRSAISGRSFSLPLPHILFSFTEFLGHLYVHSFLSLLTIPPKAYWKKRGWVYHLGTSTTASVCNTRLEQSSSFLTILLVP